MDLFRLIQTLPFAAESAPLFERPSINLGRIQGGDAVNKVPDACRMDVDVRYLPGQSPEDVLAQIRSLDPRAEVEVLIERPPAAVPADHPMVLALLEAAGRQEPSSASVGRDGASDAVAFLEVGVPAVEFGPRRRPPRAGGVRRDRERCRRALVEFARAVAGGPPRPATRAPASDVPKKGRAAPHQGPLLAGPAPAPPVAVDRGLVHLGHHRPGRAISVGSYIYLDDTLEAAAPTPRGQGRAAGDARGAAGGPSTCW